MGVVIGRRDGRLWPIHKDGWCRRCTGGYGYESCDRCGGTGKEPVTPRVKEVDG